jgi:hypothetical protein
MISELYLELVVIACTYQGFWLVVGVKYAEAVININIILVFHVIICGVDDHDG